MIGGRVLDLSALVAFATQRSVSMSAVVWTATQEDIVLVLPSSVVSAGWATLGADGRAVLEVLLGLPVTVVDELTRDRARAVGALAAEYGWADDLPTAHAAWCALDRGWPLDTASADRYAAPGGRLGVEEVR